MSSPNDFNQAVIEEFRANDGAVKAFANTPLLLLTTTGAKSGKRRLNPLAYLKDGDRWVVVASKGGAPDNPDWYYNVIANPMVTVELGGDKTFQAQATTIDEGPERDRLFNKMVEINPGFANYARKTDRTIPVVVLERVE